MEIPTTYNPQNTEDKWYSYWLKHKIFKSTPDHRTPYTIVIPPPNVTGVLHMGHMLNNTIQDVLIRRARMNGFNACWVPGTDHASIATEAKVVAKLRNEGINKNDLSREEFLKHAWDWTHKHGGIILDQLKKLGASCDWDRTCFTMDEPRSESVLKVFVDLYNKGKIYRGVRMVNWDPAAKTAVSDEEVIYKEENSKLYYIKYIIEGSTDFVTVATTRPETILGDTAVCVNPQDERFTHLKGKKVIVPLINRVIPIIEDEYVDMEFGTGCLKITPAHDINDYEIGMKHNLEVIDILNDDGTLSAKAQILIGVDRAVARKQIAELMKAQDLLVREEEYINKVGRSERTDAVIEPKLSMQWFLKMKEISQPALENVLNDTITLYPANAKNTYRHWMENVKDWCISRQLWWGHQIPAFYIDGSNDFVVAETKEEALKLAQKKTGNANLTIDKLTQDEDALDTWFSSWLWPIAVFDGIRNPQSEDLKYYYPTQALVTAPEILFFWVARMIISGYEYMNEYPFKDVYLHGIVRDAKRRKMSKSLGNSPDPIDLMKQYGADGVRVGMLLCAPAGNDLLFDEALTEQGRNFTNKIWNACRLITGWEIDATIPHSKAAKAGIEWFDAKLNETIEKLDGLYEQYRISEALMTVYKLFWDEFSSWYLETIKPDYQKPISKETYDATIVFLDKLLKLLHPITPFITEELWQLIGTRKDGDSISIEAMPKATAYNAQLIADFEITKQAVSEIRTIRKTKNIPMRDTVALSINPNGEYHNEFDAVIAKLGNISAITMVSDKVENAASFRVKAVEYFIPIEGKIDIAEEIEKITKELEYTRGFLLSVDKKLSNERFVNSAPEQVVAVEKKKQAEAQEKITMLEERLKSLK